ENAQKRGRQKMLSVVLLHVVESPEPIDRALHLLGSAVPCVHQVKHFAIALLSIKNGNGSQRAAVPGLAAPLGIEGGLIQNHGQPALELKRANNSGAKAGQVGVRQVEALGHAAFAITNRFPRKGWLEEVRNLVCNTIECISETGGCTDLCNLSAGC